MKHYLKPVFVLATFAFLAANSVQADTKEKMVIALKTNDFELTETDISALAIGEGQTIETEGGKVIDILRTADGAEVYVDGELLEMDFDHEGLHEEHMVRKHVEIICDEDEECDKNVVILTGEDDHISDFMTEDGHTVIIHKEIELSCTDGDEGTNCDEKLVWVSEDEDIDLEELHEMHQGEQGHKVIVIKKKVVSED